MSFYKQIYHDVEALVRHHGTRDPERILKERNVKLIDFPASTKLLGMYRMIARNRFVFYNNRLHPALLRMVLAHELGHDMYHRDHAGLLEHTLLNITTEQETEANVFAAHLLLPDEEVLSLAKDGYTYSQMAQAMQVNVNLMVLKLNELTRLGYASKIFQQDTPDFFTEIDGRCRENWSDAYFL